MEKCDLNLLIYSPTSADVIQVSAAH